MTTRVVAILNCVLCLVFISVGLGVGWSLTWGPAKVHSGPSMLLVANLGFPWPAWGVLFLAYSALLVHRRLRIVGYFLGTVLFGFFTVSLVVATAQGHLGSSPLLGMSICATFGQVSAAIRSMVIAEER